MYSITTENYTELIPEDVTEVIYETYIWNISKIKFPESVSSIMFGHAFNQSLDNVEFPESLCSMVLGYRFNQSLDNVLFPKFLKSITFGNIFNNSLDNIKFPEFLESIIFGNNFNQSLENVKFGNYLESITFGNNYCKHLNNVQFPKSLHTIIFHKYNNNKMNAELELKELQIGLLNTPIIDLPVNIKKIILLKIGNGGVFEKELETIKKRQEYMDISKIPFGCEIVYES